MMKKSKTPAEGALKTARRLVKHENSVLAGVLIVMVAAIAIATRGESISPANVKNVLVRISATGIASIGQAFVILTAGIDLSVGGLSLMSSLLAARLITSRPDHLLASPAPLSLGILITLLAGIGIGSLNGSLVSRLRLPPLIVTLGMWLVTRGAGLVISGGRTITEFPRQLAFFGQGEILGLPVPIAIFLAIAAVAYFVWRYTQFGRSLYAVGGSPVSAHLSGIRVDKSLLLVYVVSGFLAAIAGLITIARTMIASTILSQGLELDSIAACVVGGVSLYGGRGNIIGVVLGVIIIGVIMNALIVMAIDPRLQELVKGIIIFGAVAVDSLRSRERVAY